MNVWGIVIPGLLLALALFSDRLVRASKKGEKAASSGEKTVQDFLFGDAVFEKDGVIRVGDTYVSIVEIEDFPGITAADHELLRFWEDFRALLNGISTDFSFLLVSEYIELQDYVRDYLRKVDENDRLSPQLKESARHVAEHILAYEQQDFRQYRNYIILKYNLLSAYAGGELSTGVHRLDTLVRELKKTSATLPTDEGERLRMARTVLADYEALIFQFAERYHLYVRKLGDEEAYRLIRRFVLRSVLRSDDVPDAGRRTHPVSETAQILRESGVTLRADSLRTEEEGKRKEPKQTFRLAE